MGLFKSKYEKAMDNYKDAAQENFREIEELFKKLCEEGVLKYKVKAEYGEKLEAYRVKLKGYTHKDQKPFWT